MEGKETALLPRPFYPSEDFFFEHSGAEAERAFYSCRRDAILERRFPYFSLLIVRRG